MSINLHFRQGDVMLDAVASIPKSAVKVEQSLIVLQFGSSTGHKHAMGTEHATEFKTETERFIKVDAPTDLIHDEHSTIPIPSGSFKIVQQREFSPEAIRDVLD
jgi:peptidyl-tRNA hydrolase